MTEREEIRINNMNINRIGENSTQSFVSFGMGNKKKQQKTQASTTQLTDRDFNNHSKAITAAGKALLFSTILAQAASIAAGLPAKAKAENIQVPPAIHEKGSMPDYTSAIIIPTSNNETGLTNKIQIHANKKLPVNENGFIIIDITKKAAKSNKDSITLREITNETYSEALSSFKLKNQKITAFNKIINAIEQNNPELSDYIQKQPGVTPNSYNEIADLKLGKSSLNSGKIILPQTIEYKEQLDKKTDSFVYTSRPVIIEDAQESESVEATPANTAMPRPTPSATPAPTPERTPIACSFEDIFGASPEELGWTTESPVTPTSRPTPPSPAPTAEPTPIACSFEDIFGASPEELGLTTGSPVTPTSRPTPPTPAPTPEPTPIACSFEDIFGCSREEYINKHSLPQPIEENPSNEEVQIEDIEGTAPSVEAAVEVIDSAEDKE